MENTADIAKAISLPVCRIFCGNVPGTLWPKPTGAVAMGNMVAKIGPGQITIRAFNHRKDADFWSANEQRLLRQIHAKIPKRVQLKDDGQQLNIDINVEKMDDQLTVRTDESYTIKAKELNGAVEVSIVAPTIFGARHALETLSQLIVFDDIRMELQILADFEIRDAPAYKHRGLLLDTARNYFSIESIKRTIGE